MIDVIVLDQLARIPKPSCDQFAPYAEGRSRWLG